MRAKGAFFRAARMLQFKEVAEPIPRPTWEQANEYQVRHFFNYFDPEFRLNKILSLRFLLQRREEFGRDVAAFYRTPDRGNDQAIYHRFTNGIIHAAAAEYAMLCEDLFALMRFCRDPQKFVKRIGRYRPNELAQWVEGWEPPDTPPSVPPDPEGDRARQRVKSEAYADLVRRAFFLPPADQVVGIDAAVGDDYRKSIREYVHATRRLQRDFDRWRFAYTQHKHGLKSALRWAGDLTEEALKDRRNGLYGGMASFDTDPATEDRVRRRPLIFPYDKRLVPVLRELMEDGNFLRIYAESRHVEIDTFVRHAREVTALMLCLIHNRLEIGKEQEGDPTWSVWVPFPPSDVTDQNLSPMARKVFNLQAVAAPGLAAFQLPELDQSMRERQSARDLATNAARSARRAAAAMAVAVAPPPATGPGTEPDKDAE